MNPGLRIRTVAVVMTLVMSAAPAVADTNPMSLQRDADAVHALGVTGVLARLETRTPGSWPFLPAKGVLMAMHGCTADEAFTMMVKRSQHSNVRVSKLALDLLTSVSTPPTPNR